MKSNITFLHDDTDVAAKMLSARITNELKNCEQVLWLVPGGSNIPISVAIMNEIRKKVAEKELTVADLGRLTVTLTDERYGAVGHKDSNWQQLIAAGFSFTDIKTIPWLRATNNSSNKSEGAFSKSEDSAKNTLSVVANDLRLAFEQKTICIGQFGMGADGHIAGVLPDSPGVSSKEIAVAYQAPTYTRMTLTLAALRNVDVAYAFVFGESKRVAIADLKNKKLPPEKQPAAVLHHIKEAWVVVD